MAIGLGVPDRSAMLPEKNERVGLPARFSAVRLATLDLCEPLEIEDYGIQSMPDCSPVKWHLAHTTWFFETFLLKRFVPDYRPEHPQFETLFNSYYNAVGSPWPRPQRGLLSRPTVVDVYHYRAAIDERMTRLLSEGELPDEALPILILGLNHEQQHQELILTDLKHAFALNPLNPVFRPRLPASGACPPLDWVAFSEGTHWLGHDGNGFAFDNESPRHRVFLNGFRLANRLATNEDFLAFMEDGGYDRPEFWLSDGWAARKLHGWTAPLYWRCANGSWQMMTLGGLSPIDPAEPVCHVSYYEADAFARWAGARLPTEAEWEVASGSGQLAGHFLEAKRFHPSAAPADDDAGPLVQMFGDVWQWTASPYVGYPGYQPLAGALGEYNGKFMCNQLVLRGASCATPRSHARPTYRNFFPPDARWQFTGLRLAQDLE